MSPENVTNFYGFGGLMSLFLAIAFAAVISLVAWFFQKKQKKKNEKSGSGFEALDRASVQYALLRLGRPVCVRVLACNAELSVERALAAASGCHKTGDVIKINGVVGRNECIFGHDCTCVNHKKTIVKYAVPPS